jgi:hypothetical protein
MHLIRFRRELSAARRLVATIDRAFGHHHRGPSPTSCAHRTPLITKVTESKRRVRFPDCLADQPELSRRAAQRRLGRPCLGGDRLPWVSIEGRDNYASLAAITWQVHVYGLASAELTAGCADHDVPLHVFDWRSEHHAAGLARDALYLLRPDPCGACHLFWRCEYRPLLRRAQKRSVWSRLEPNPSGRSTSSRCGCEWDRGRIGVARRSATSSLSLFASFRWTPSKLAYQSIPVGIRDPALHSP